jgi:hypothetical protein
MKSSRENIRIFDTRTGARGFVPPSSITCPILAAITSGFPRAVLSEILSRLPGHVRILSATTDGWLSDCTSEEARAATEGPICRWFAKLRATVDPKGSEDILEQKHAMLEVLVARTRHGITVVPVEGSDYFIARAGYRLPTDFSDFDAHDPEARMKSRAAEAAAFVQLQRSRTHDTKLMVKSFISLSRQWEEVSDLVEVHREVQVALCYDMKREPADPVDVDLLINFTTRPWTSLKEALDSRDDLDRWKGAAKAVLKTADDWKAFQAWRAKKRRRGFARRTPFENAVVTAWAKGRAGFAIRSRAGRVAAGQAAPPSKAEVASILTGMGVEGVTPRTLNEARRKEQDPVGTVDELLPSDAELFRQLVPYASVEGLNSLLRKPEMAPEGCFYGPNSAQSNSVQVDTPTKVASNRVFASAINGKVRQHTENEGKSDASEILEANLVFSTRGEGWKNTIEMPLEDQPDQPLEAAPGPAPRSVSADAPGTAVKDSPWVSSPDDVKHLARIKAGFSQRHGVTRVGWLQGIKAAAKRAGLSPRQRDILAVALAVAARLRTSERDAFRIVAELAAATLDPHSSGLHHATA